VARFEWLRSTGDKPRVARAHEEKTRNRNHALHRLDDVHAELRLLATEDVTQATEAAVGEANARLGVVEAVFNDPENTPPSAIGTANESLRLKRAKFIKVAGRELGIRKH
jgi:hypothetical protein